MTEESKRNMFSDRRRGLDRRKQRLPMPTGLDRRNRRCRRSRQFQAQPWWLRINYAAELVSEKTVIESDFIDRLKKSRKKPPASEK